MAPNQVKQAKQVKQEKPQGWCRAKKEGHGRFSCYYDCKQVFKTRHEAEDHSWNCSEREKVLKDMEKMAVEAGVPDLSPLASPKKGSAERSAARSSTSSSSEEWKFTDAAADKPEPNEKKRFKLILRGLPRVDMLTYL